jgi:hypothetical protein
MKKKRSSPPDLGASEISNIEITYINNIIKKD